MSGAGPADSAGSTNPDTAADSANPRVEADRSRCCGSGMCTLTVPAVFDQDDADGLVVVLDPAPPRDLHEAVRDAVALCPASAISFAGG